VLYSNALCSPIVASTIRFGLCSQLRDPLITAGGKFVPSGASCSVVCDVRNLATSQVIWYKANSFVITLHFVGILQCFSFNSFSLAVSFTALSNLIDLVYTFTWSCNVGVLAEWLVKWPLNVLWLGEEALNEMIEWLSIKPPRVLLCASRARSKVWVSFSWWIHSEPYRGHCVSAAVKPIQCTCSRNVNQYCCLWVYEYYIRSRWNLFLSVRISAKLDMCVTRCFQRL